MSNGIKIDLPFTPTTPTPIDTRTVVETIAERNDIDALSLYEGLEVYVKENSTKYRWIGTEWETVGSSGSGTAIDDTQASDTTTYSSNKIEADYQKINDNILTTNNKTIVGSINELNEEIGKKAIKPIPESYIKVYRNILEQPNGKITNGNKCTSTIGQGMMYLPKADYVLYHIKNNDVIENSLQDGHTYTLTYNSDSNATVEYFIFDYAVDAIDIKCIAKETATSGTKITMPTNSYWFQMNTLKSDNITNISLVDDAFPYDNIRLVVADGNVSDANTQIAVSTIGDIASVGEYIKLIPETIGTVSTGIYKYIDDKVGSNESVDTSIFQTINDDSLTTDDKTIVGAINELDTNKLDKPETDGTAGQILVLQDNGSLAYADNVSEYDDTAIQEELDTKLNKPEIDGTAGQILVLQDDGSLAYADNVTEYDDTKKQDKLIAGNNIEILDDNTINSINEIPEYLSADENKVLTVKLNTDTNTPKLEWEDVSATGTINVKVTENDGNTDEIYKLNITQFDNDTQTTTTTTTPNLKGKDGVNGTDGTDGKNVTIKENADNNDTTYKLDITKWNEDTQTYETITTPNLRGIDGVDGIDAKDITIKENANNNDTTYKLDITKWNEDTQTYETITTPNLRGNSLTNIEENADNTDTVYKLDITSFDNDAGEYTTITTPNLKQLVIPTSRPEILVNGAIWIE